MEMINNTPYTFQEIEEIHSTLTMLVRTLARQPEQEVYRQVIADYRKVDKSAFDNLQCFFVSDPQEIRQVITDQYYTDTRYGFMSISAQPVFRGRFVYPCYNVKNQVCGMVGYDKDHKYKYLLSSTLGFDKKNITFGFQDLKFIFEQGYVILVEGVMDWVRLRMLGYPVLCLQGTGTYDIVINITKHLKGVVLLLDSDDAGILGSLYAKKVMPNATRLQLDRGKLNKMDADIFLRYNENIQEFKTIIDTLRFDKWNRLDYTSVFVENKSQDLTDYIEFVLAKKKEIEDKNLELASKNTLNIY